MAESDSRSGTQSPDLHPVWKNRILRAKELAERYASSRDVLTFYHDVLLFQQDLYRFLSKEKTIIIETAATAPFSNAPLEIALTQTADFSTSFLKLIGRVGSEALSKIAGRLLADQKGGWAQLLQLYWEDQLPNTDFKEGSWLFFPKVFLQPCAEVLAHTYHRLVSDGDADWQVSQGSTACPFCRKAPQLAILRTEGEGASRWLQCCLCATEWRHKRVSCPACGDETHSNHSYHKTPDFAHVRVEVCGACNHYIKGIDLTQDGHAVPVVDEAATIPLDLWAVDQGYMKIEMNLIGM